MSKKVALLSCAGYKKIWGLIAQEIAFRISELNSTIKSICPPLHSTNSTAYKDLIETSDVIIVDGCASNCATKMLTDYQFGKLKKYYIPDLAKEFGIKIEKSLRITDEGLKLADLIAKRILEDIKITKSTPEKSITRREIEPISYNDVMYDKFKFRVPKKDYYFIENDSWIKPIDDTALVGISDYLQTKASDVLFIDLPEIGQKFDQFDEIVDFESVKAVLQLILPVSGEVMAVNEELQNTPDLLNSDPYEHGWVVEIKMTDFDSDKELLMSSSDYFEYMKKKIESEL